MRSASIVSLVIAAACSGPPRTLPPPAGPDVPAGAVEAERTAEPVEAHWVVVQGGTNVGTYDLTTAPDGTMKGVYHVLQNGRGPHNEATFKLGDDGGLDRFEATGH